MKTIKKERNYGIDALRILTMLMIVILHILGQGGVLDNTTVLSKQYEFAWLLEIISYCAVNCYGIISGYVCLYSEIRYSRGAMLWLQTIFYTIGFVIVFYLLGSELVTKQRIINAFFPITSRQYWYITAYFGLFLFISLLNAAIKNISHKEFKAFLCSFFVVISIIPTILKIHLFDINTDPYRLNNGYSMLWLCFLYLIGGYIRKYKLFDKVKNIYFFCGYIIAVLFTWLTKYLYEKAGIKDYGNIFVNYTSPTIVCAGIFLFLFFVNIKFKQRLARKIIESFAPVTLGVYIIHTNPLIWNKFEGFASMFAHNSTGVMLIEVLFAAIGIYLVCSFIDLFRKKLFGILKIEVLLRKLDAKLQKGRDKEYT